MKSHRFDPISFVSGLVIALLGLAFLIPQTPVDVVDVVTNLGSWFWPALLLLIGAAVLVPVFATRREDEELEDKPESDQPGEGTEAHH